MQGFMVRTLAGKDVKIVNVCDPELVGTTINDGGFQMKISREYFEGDLVNTQEVIELIRNSDVANLVGKKIVDLVLEAEMASREAVRVVGGTAFLMIYKFS